MNRAKGFTLLELLIVMAIAGFLVAVAVPNFSETIKRNRMTANANEVFASVQYARTEALRRGGSVVLTPADGSTWVNGFRVFADANGNNAYDSGEEELRVWGKLKGGSTLVAEGGAEGQGLDDKEGYWRADRDSRVHEGDGRH